MSGGNKLGGYLAAIAAGNPVSRKSVQMEWGREGIPSSDLDEVLDFSGGACAPVRVIDRDFFNRLLEHYGSVVDMSSKASAAITGSSHRFASMHAITLVCSHLNPHPIAVVSGAEGVVMPRRLGTVGIVIENLELFIRFRETLQFCIDKAGLDRRLAESIEVVYGAGASVTSHPCAKFLQTFVVLYCLPDMDAGGLQICATLSKRLPDVELSILFPSALSHMLESAGVPLTELERVKLVGLSKIKLTSEPANILLLAGKKLEQEVYLV